MDIVSKQDIQQLAEIQSSACVSIYSPTERAGREVRQGPIRFKNLLKQVESQLQEQDVSDEEVTKCLQPAQKLLEDDEFWQHQSDGLAVFAAPDQFRYFRLPLELPELAVVTDHFHLKPLMPLITIDGRFYVLALSQNQVRILHGTRLSVSELDVEEIPSSLAEALRFDDPEVSLQFRQGGAETGDSRAANFHGHGAGDDEQKTRLLRYFQQIDRGLQELLAADTAPLVLAGVEYYFPIYREANSYNHLLEEGIPGNPEHLDTEELHARAWKIVEPVFRQKLKESKDDFHQALHKGQASADLKEIVRNAPQGRVGTLFVARGQQRWGNVNLEKNSVLVHDEQQAGDKDLLDYAALQAFQTGATVYVVEPDHMPNGDSIAAIYRY